MSDLRELYQQVIIDHGRCPRNRGALTAANYTQEGFNPLCGDKIILYAEVKDDVIIDLSFEGAGCAISIASASLLTETIKGSTLSEAMDLFNDFQQFVMAGTKSDRLGKLIVLGGVREFPARVKCAVLAWHTLKALWTREKIVVSTE